VSIMEGEIWLNVYTALLRLGFVHDRAMVMAWRLAIARNG